MYYTHLWPPARSLGGPAELSLAHTAPDPVTALLLLHNHTTAGAAHGVSLGQHALQKQGVGEEGDRACRKGQQCV